MAQATFTNKAKANKTFTNKAKANMSNVFGSAKMGTVKFGDSVFKNK